MSTPAPLSIEEIQKLMSYVGTKRHGKRDRLMLLLTFQGVSISEIANLKIGNVLAGDGSIKSALALSANKAKGRHSRNIPLNDHVREEMRSLLEHRFPTMDLRVIASSSLMGMSLFTTAKSLGFSPNTACHHIFMLYREAGVNGSSGSGVATYQLHGSEMINNLIKQPPGL